MRHFLWTTTMLESYVYCKFDMLVTDLAAFFTQIFKIEAPTFESCIPQCNQHRDIVTNFIFFCRLSWVRLFNSTLHISLKWLKYKTYNIRYIIYAFNHRKCEKSVRQHPTVTIDTKKQKNCQPAKNFRTGAHSRFVFVEKSFQPNRHDRPVQKTPTDLETKYSPVPLKRLSFDRVMSFLPSYVISLTLIWHYFILD